MARAVRRLRAIPLLEVRLEHRREGHPLSELFERDGAEARLIACRLTDHVPQRLLRWLDVDVPPERMEHLLHAVQLRIPRRDLALAPLGPGRVLIRVGERAPSVCAATYRAGGICVSCPLMAPRGNETWRVVLPRGEQTKAFLRDLPSSSGGQFALAPPKTYTSGTTLTRRQDRALRTAYDLGYFDYPRRGSLATVARALGVGRSATLEILRRATAKLAGNRYGTELRPRTVP